MQDGIVGRAADLERLAALWSRGVRRVTLWGAGGVGKTRLARTCAGGWSGRTWWCDLSRAHDQDALCAVVGDALGLSPSPRQAVDQIGHALGHQGAGLLVLDGFEQLSHCASVLLAWERRAPSLSLLLTSRQRLHLPGEVNLELLPLALPEPGQDARQADAVRLFLDCARASHPGFVLDEASVGPLGELVARLEGNPLAIELAASRLEVMGLGGLLGRVPTSLEVPSAPRGSESRQGSFRAAIAWSWGLLDDRERRVLARCSVFVGGFTLADAEALLGAEDVLAVLSSLRDQSMLQSAASAEGSARLSMYESLRVFAREQLALGGELTVWQERHAALFVRREVVTSVDRENLVAALTFRLAGPPDEPAQHEALRLLLAVDPLLARQGPHGLHAHLLDQTLAACTAGATAVELLAQAHAARSRLRLSQGDMDGSLEDLRHALSLAQSGGSPHVLAQVQLEHGLLHHRQRDLAAAEQHYQAALATLAPLPMDALHARALGNLGALLHDARKPDQARAAYGRALAFFRRHADPRLEGIFLANLALLEQESGQLAAARDALERAAALLAETRDARLLGITLANHGALLHELGEPALAREQLRHALVRLRQVGDLRSEALCLARLGAVEASLGLTREASVQLDQAESLLERAADPTALAGLPVYRAFVELAQAASARSPAAAAVALARARRRMQAVTEPVAAGPSAWELLDDVRTALRIAQPWAERLGRAASPGELPTDALLVGPEGDWFQPPGGAPQSLRLRRPLRAMFALLVARRLDGQGAELSELQEAAWPGEKMSPAAALNRVRVALAELRKRGLQGCLVRQGDRYLLHASVPLVVTAVPMAEPP